MKKRYWKLFVSIDGKEFQEEFASSDLDKVIEEMREWQESETDRHPKIYKTRVDYRLESSPAE